MDVIYALLDQLKMLSGFAALFVVIVNAGKYIGIVKDGQSDNVYGGLNLILLVALYVARLKGFDISNVDALVATIAQIGALFLALAYQVGLGAIVHELLRGKVPILGFSYSARKEKEALETG